MRWYGPPPPAEAELLAGVAGADEGGEEAVGHVAPVGAQGLLARRRVIGHRADGADEDALLLLDGRLGGEPGEEAGGGLVALGAGGRGEGGGRGQGGGEQEQLGQGRHSRANREQQNLVKSFRFDSKIGSNRSFENILVLFYGNREQKSL